MEIHISHWGEGQLGGHLGLNLLSSIGLGRVRKASQGTVLRTFSSSLNNYNFPANPISGLANYEQALK